MVSYAVTYGILLAAHRDLKPPKSSPQLLQRANQHNNCLPRKYDELLASGYETGA